MKDNNEKNLIINQIDEVQHILSCGEESLMTSLVNFININTIYVEIVFSGILSKTKNNVSILFRILPNKTLHIVQFLKPKDL